MTPTRVSVTLMALVAWSASAAPTQAGWANVFQVCCNHCGHRAPAVSGYAAFSSPVAVAAPDPCCNPCPPVCCTRYVQRCYYQPVTCYQTKTYYEPVTTYKTSYYCEPVTTYRYSCYYDPCTCSYQQVACPTTSYVMRSQCCAVQSWVQRCCQVPVTTYQQVNYWEPVTTCCQPVNPCCPNGNGLAAAPAAPPVTAGKPPAVDEPPPARKPAVTEPAPTGSPLQYDRSYPPSDPRMPPGGASLKVPAPKAPPIVKLDQIVSVQPGHVEGRVLSTNQQPQAGAHLRFVSLQRHGPQHPVTAGADGRFQVQLTKGTWLVYLHGTDGRLAFHSKLEVGDKDPRPMILVSK